MAASALLCLVTGDPPSFRDDRRDKLATDEPTLTTEAIADGVDHTQVRHQLLPKATQTYTRQGESWEDLDHGDGARSVLPPVAHRPAVLPCRQAP